MQSLPEAEVYDRLLQGLRKFGISAARTTYLRVGFGDYHWKITGSDGAIWFATVSDLDHKEHCGHGAEAALNGLRRAMETASTLYVQAHLQFVVAPGRSTNGDFVVSLDSRYALAVFPFTAGTTGQYGQQLSATEREHVVNLLARLHNVQPPASTPATMVEPPGLDDILTALDEPASKWKNGPFSAKARELLEQNADVLHARIDEFRNLAQRVQQTAGPLVVTHGEPHPGNLIRDKSGYLLVDWDTVGLAAPERDLSLLCCDPTELAGYMRLTGHAPDMAGIDLYRLRWRLLDAVEFTAWFRAAHTESPDANVAWRSFKDTVEQLCRAGMSPI